MLASPGLQRLEGVADQLRFLHSRRVTRIKWIRVSSKGPWRWRRGDGFRRTGLRLSKPTLPEFPQFLKQLLPGGNELLAIPPQQKCDDTQYCCIQQPLEQI